MLFAAAFVLVIVATELCSDAGEPSACRLFPSASLVGDDLITIAEPIAAPFAASRLPPLAILSINESHDPDYFQWQKWLRIRHEGELRALNSVFTWDAHKGVIWFSAAGGRGTNGLDHFVMRRVCERHADGRWRINDAPAAIGPLPVSRKLVDRVKYGFYPGEDCAFYRDYIGADGDYFAAILGTGEHDFQLFIAPSKRHVRAGRAAYATRPDLLRVYDVAVQGATDEHGKGWFMQCKLREEIRTPFISGRFIVIPDNDKYYFLLHSGEMYVSRRTTAGAPRETLEARIRDGELVQLLIYDGDRDDKPFAFTSKYWFEVKQPFEYREFDLGVVKADDPTPTLIRCAREVRKHYPALPAKSDKPPSDSR